MFKSNAALVYKNSSEMSLNRYEQTLFTYWEQQPDERRHWQSKVAEITRGLEVPVEVARALERELWDHLVERAPHVPALRALGISTVQRVSLLNLAEYIVRLWGPPPKPKKSGTSSA
jgi:hypothetical protein